MPDVPQRVLDLVEIFRNNSEEYCNPAFNEANLRKQFVDPLFKCLGWDMDNEQGHAEAYKEVIHEASLKIGEQTKAPDYCFRIGGTPKFYLEAKKPYVKIKDDPVPAYQLRRYGWSRKLPISILTDFEEFAVYDCRIKPQETDKASTARVMYFRYEDYPAKWAELVSLFSKDGINKGSFDKYAEGTKGKRGTATVDAAFLAEIESWRLELAKNIALRNPNIESRELNYAVQMTIDRIIFLRICEDRGIENYAQLRDLADDNGIYAELCKLFRKADQRYNSGLFHFEDEKGRPEGYDALTPTLDIDDKVLKPILTSLYYPKSPYVFSVLPADILGQVYEQFLGKVIRLTAGHLAKVEEKPEVKKAGGVYYTPTYIVDYIVKNTVGKLLENKTPKQAAKITVLDPACGSGSFLLGAYDYLLKWHLDYYTGKDQDPKMFKKEVFQSAGIWRLTTAERKRILLNNIYGVDIDTQAVEVTKLSLLLKVLEGESQETLKSQLTFAHERALPDLAGNIKCGNSLIGPDFYISQQHELFDNEEKLRINVFDWNKGFPTIMKAGGFDAVIGNPPWGAELTEHEKSYTAIKYASIPTKTKDTYLYFIVRAMIALRESGTLSFIVSNTWLLINNAKGFRKDLLAYVMREIIDHGDGVFAQATVESSTFILEKSKDAKSSHLCHAQRYKKGQLVIDHYVDKQLWLNDEYCRIIVDIKPETAGLQQKLKTISKPFKDGCTITWGIKPYQTGYGTPPQTREMIDNRIYHSQKQIDSLWKPLLVGSDVNRYAMSFPGDQYIKYGKWLMYPSNERLMLGHKLLMRQTSDSLRVCYDPDGYYCQNSVFVIHSEAVNMYFLLALLNSRLMDFVYKMNNPQKGKVFAEVKPSVIKELPIWRPIINSSNKANLKYESIIEYAKVMILTTKQFSKAKTPHEKTALQAQIDATDAAIDALVYELYGLTEAEIAIVEAATAR